MINNKRRRSKEGIEFPFDYAVGSNCKRQDEEIDICKRCEQCERRFDNEGLLVLEVKKK